MELKHFFFGKTIGCPFHLRIKKATVIIILQKFKCQTGPGCMILVYQINLEGMKNGKFICIHILLIIDFHGVADKSRSYTALGSLVSGSHSSRAIFRYLSHR